MSLWILAIGIVAIFVGIGFAQGAIRSAISLVGLILGLLLAVPFGGMLKPLLAPLGVTNPVWQVLIPPVVAFLLIYLIVSGLSFFAHHKVYLMYKYKRDDVDRIRWERMNRNAGAAVGALMGVILFLAVSGLVYAGGYLTVQLSGDENPGTIQFINNVRQDMANSGFDKVAAKFQPASPAFYESADVLGLLYHNPLLQGRLSNYPYFLSLGQRPEFQEMATDREYNDLVFGKAPVTAIIAHERTQTILGNDEIMEYLHGADRRDLKEYLRTGKSPKYAEEEILGVWDLDKNAVLTLLRKSNPDIKAKDLRLLKASLEAMPDISLAATPDNKVYVRGASQAPEAAAEETSANTVFEDSGPGYSMRIQAANPRAVTAPSAAPSAPEPAKPPIPQLLEEGTWSEEAGRYVVTLTTAGGSEIKGTAQIRADEMILTLRGSSLVFEKL